MKELFDKIEEFNKCFDIPEHNKINHHIPDKNIFLYYELMREEGEEYRDAIIDRDKVEVADALIDELYVLIGKFRKHGISCELATKMFDNVHESNMSKLGENNKPIRREDGKILKGPNYFRPNLKAIIDEHYAEEGVHQ